MTIIVEGPLQRPAEHGTRIADRTCQVTLLLHPGPGFPVEARVPYGNDHLLSQAVATSGRRGAWVRVEAEGVLPRTDHGVAAMVLTNIKFVQIDGETVFPPRA